MYQCECGAENWLTLNEAIAYGKFVCIMCEKITEVEPISNIIVHYTQSKPVILLQDKSDKQEKPRPKQIPKPEIDHFVDMLVGLGYKKGVARRLVETAIQAGQSPANENEFINYLLKQLRV